MRAIDLFCGIGGFHYAAAEHGIDTVFACEADPSASAQYTAATGVNPAGDIHEVFVGDVPDHDLMMAGFPCQPYSVMGLRMGLVDSRGRVVAELFRLLEGKRPKAFVFENVRNLQSHDRGKTLAYLESELVKLGYDVQHFVLNALDFGLPQKRERLFIVGFDPDQTGAWLQFSPPEPRERSWSLTDVLVPDETVDDRHWLSDEMRSKFAAKHRTDLRPAIWHENKAGNVSSHPFSCALRAGASYNYLTVNGERRLTEREMLRLQGFPDRFFVVSGYAQLRKQCGNAVPVPMASAVIGEMSRALHASS